MRWLWWAALAALAPVVIFAQLDQAGERNPALAAAVPEPFRSMVQSHVAVASLKAASPDEALEEARTLVRRRPMPAEHLFALSLAHLRAGKEAEFAQAFRAATTRGWRYVPLQIAAARAAIDNGDASGGAQRITAAWLGRIDDSAIAPLIRAQAALPTGPEELGRTLAASRIGNAEYIARLMEITSPQVTLRVARAAQSSGEAVDCATREMIRSRLEILGETLPETALPCS